MDLELDAYGIKQIIEAIKKQQHEDSENNLYQNYMTKKDEKIKNAKDLLSGNNATINQLESAIIPTLNEEENKAKDALDVQQAIL